MDFCEIRITRDRIVVPPAEADAARCGAILDFHGIVRPREGGRPLAGIDYEAHPRMAERELQAVIAHLAADSDLQGCRLVHRIGYVAAGETSLILRVATPHRASGYELSRAIMEELKRRVPIWKRPIFAA